MAEERVQRRLAAILAAKLNPNDVLIVAQRGKLRLGQHSDAA